MSPHPERLKRTAELEEELRALFRDAGWSVDRGHDADLVVHGGNRTYVVQMKTATEGRPDRLVPLLAQAILEARVAAQEHGRRASPLAIVAARRLSRRALEQVSEFARVHAPDVAFGAIDSHGLRYFSGKGLEALNAQPHAPVSRGVSVEPKVDLFSDLNQWLIKVLLAPHVNDRDRLNAPIGEYQNATQLAAAGNVSVMTAFRFLRELAAEGFLQDVRSGIRLLRVEELLRRWQSSAIRRVPEIRARWILPGDLNRVRKALHARRGKACLALFAAAEALGLGFVHGAVTHIYVRELHTADLRKMGVLRTEPGQSFDVVLKSPVARESVFRGAVEVDGLLSCDVLQVWLDVSSHPSRGFEQAERMYTRVLKPMIKRATDAGR